MRKEYKQLLNLAEKVAKKRAISLSTIGNLAIKNGRIFNTLMGGGYCSPNVYDRLMDWLQAEVRK